ncbi:MAG: hypothetical protein U0V73_11400 [Acidimicrobiia bacterium]
MATIFTVVFGTLGFSLGLGRLWDNSLFWHIRTGELILDHGIPHHDPYSFTHHGIPWIAQSWLAELLYGVLYRSVLGPFGIRLLTGLVIGTIAVVSFRLALRLTRDVARAVLVAVAAMLGIVGITTPRPLIFGALAFVLLVCIVELPESRAGRAAAVSIPAVMWIWANVHGTFELGFAYLGLHLVGSWLDGMPPTRGAPRRVAIGTLLASAVVFVNPYGVDLVRFPLDLLSRGGVLSRVVEWQSPSLRTDQGKLFAVWLAVFVVAAMRSGRRMSWRDGLLSVTFVLLAFWAQRNIILTPLVLLPVLARCVSVEHAPKDSTVRFGWVVVAVVVLLGLRNVAYEAAQPDFDLGPYPVAAMKYLDRHGMLGRRLLHDDGVGGYLIIRYWPKQRVFFDDRFDMYPVSFSHEYFDVADGRPGWDRILRKYRIDAVVWKKDAPLAQLLARSPGWRRVHRDKVAVVFVRTRG